MYVECVYCVAFVFPTCECFVSTYLHVAYAFYMLVLTLYQLFMHETDTKIAGNFIF